MTLHYMEWIEGMDREAARGWVLDWIAHNPPEGPCARWAGWNAYALSLRVVVWMQVWARHGWSPEAPPPAVIQRSMLDQLRDLSRRLERDLGGNHLIKNLKALIWGAAFFRGDEATQWFNQAQRLLDRELQSQILPDGFHFERSPAYHLQVLADLLEIRQVWPPEIPCPLLDEALDRMAQVAADMTHPDGLTSQFSDGGLHMSYAPARCLEVYQFLRGRVVAPRATFVLPDGGYVGLRNGTSLVLWDVGPVGADHLPAHGHADLLALEWSVNGQRVLVYPGVYEYETGPLRALCRGTFGHNTVTIESADQCELWGSFRLGRRSRATLDQIEFKNGHFEASAHHPSYKHLPGSPVHYRRILSDGHRLEVIDRIDSTRAVAAQATFLLHPACVPIGGGIFETPIGRIGFTSTAAWELREFEWFPDLGTRFSTHLLVIQLDSLNIANQMVWNLLP